MGEEALIHAIQPRTGRPLTVWRCSCGAISVWCRELAEAVLRAALSSGSGESEWADWMPWLEAWLDGYRAHKRGVPEDESMLSEASNGYKQRGAARAKVFLQAHGDSKLVQKNPNAWDEPASASSDGETEPRRTDERKWTRAFTRLEKAVQRHMDAKGWTDDADDALHAAHKRIMRDVGPFPESVGLSDAQTERAAIALYDWAQRDRGYEGGDWDSVIYEFKEGWRVLAEAVLRAALSPGHGEGE